MAKDYLIHYLRDRDTNTPVGCIIAIDADHIGYAFQHPNLDHWNDKKGRTCAINRCFPLNRQHINKKTKEVREDKRNGLIGGYTNNRQYVAHQMDYYAIKGENERYSHMLMIYRGLTDMKKRAERYFNNPNFEKKFHEPFAKALARQEQLAHEENNK